MIVESSNDYIAALKGNQPNLFKDVKTNFTAESTYQQVNKGHGRIEKRSVSICQTLDGLRSWPGLKTLIRVESERQIIRHNHIEVEKETRYYISSLSETAREFGDAPRGLAPSCSHPWLLGCANLVVHYVRDVTQGEDGSRIRTLPLPQIFAIARNFTLNLYRHQMFENMAGATTIMLLWVRHTQATL